MLNGFDSLVLGLVILVIAFVFAIMSVRQGKSVDIMSYISDHGIMVPVLFVGAVLALYGALAVPTGH